MATEFTIDFSDFAKKFKKIAEDVVPSLAEKGVGRATLQLLNDCVMEVPTVPLLESFLRGSGSAFVQNKLVAVSEHGKPRDAATVSTESIKPGDVVGMVGFNSVYAARQHEGIDFKFTEPSSGPKYLESKLHRNKERYFSIIANTIKEGGNKT